MEAGRSWYEEMQAAWLYRQLAAVEPDARMAALFTELGQAADMLAQRWQRLMGEPPVFRPQLRARLVATLARHVAPKRLRTILGALKVRGLSAYDATADGHPLQQHIEHIRRHRVSSGGNLRAAVFGVNDGLVSNASLILGMVGAGAGDATVLAAGVAGLLAGALSMAAGEYVSMRSQRELFEHQIGLERDELADNPEAGVEKLALIYAARGIAPEDARRIATRLMAQPKHAINVLAREYLGLNPEDLGSPTGAAMSSFSAFAVGASLPLLPFALGFTLPGAAWAGASLGAAGLFATGALMSLFTGRSASLGGLRMLAIGGSAGAATFAIGQLIGVSIG